MPCSSKFSITLKTVFQQKLQRSQTNNFSKVIYFIIFIPSFFFRVDFRWEKRQTEGSKDASTKRAT